jgi:hypothetical protein
MDIRSQLEKDSLEFAKAYTPRAVRRHEDLDYAIAHMAGARQVLIYLNDFVYRVSAQIGEPKGEFEQGQKDGINWAIDHLLDLFGELGEE